MAGTLPLQKAKNPLLMCAISSVLLVRESEFLLGVTLESRIRRSQRSTRTSTVTPVLWFTLCTQFVLFGRIQTGISRILCVFSSSTGARQVTFVAHNFCDIQGVRRSSPSTFILSIVQWVSKNSRLVPHVVSLEGNPTSEDPIDFIYLFATYLKRSFGIEFSENLLEDAVFIELVKSRTSLWGYLTRDSWGLRLNFRFTSAGFPDSFFVPHSTRSGFLISAMVTAKHLGGDVNSALDRAATVAQWTRKSPVQLRYLRQGYDKLIVGTLCQILFSKNRSNDPDSFSFGSPQWYRTPSIV